MYDRSKTIGASDAVMIQAGEWAELYDRKTSPKPAEWPLPAELGKELESLNRRWFTRATSLHIVLKDEWADNPIRLVGHDWCTYTPDGLVNKTVPFEAKAVNMMWMWKPENLLAKYMPQLQHAMRVMGSDHAYFSVIYLNTKYEFTSIPYDPPYDDALFEKEKLFHWFLTEGQRPPQKKGRKWI